MIQLAKPLRSFAAIRPLAERRIEILTERGELKPAPASLASDDPDRG